ncbi:MAG: HEAT repeat domain-containing protein [Verrucomicrobiota bacterium]
MPRPGWHISLVAEAPVLRHPSVVACAPDGRLFVAEDPMDITRPAHVAEGRILCRHNDGRWTVFAEGLHGVFGMHYLEGRLYVLHNPRFSVFRDDQGVGRDRGELVDQTNPNPWALDWNDHVPANFRLGMDGFFYVAVGDKGLFKARGRDGRTVNLHGGGVVRIRPDGSGLAVVSTGVRNILDIAGTAEDDWFTYDNTDENQWMGRLTHMIDGGFYGYPFDFIPRRPYTLWMLADYGAGAATGMACALGDALPPTHRGNLFLADFGQRNIRRVALQRDGATFRAAFDENLFLETPPDFRPVGIAFTDDNAALYVCDWQHRDTKEQAVAGRLWKLSPATPEPSRALPSWHVAHGIGQAVEVPQADLVTALSHAVHAVRLSAQRLLARQGNVSIPALAAALDNPRLEHQARIHALWALHAISPAEAALVPILKASRSPDPAVARQALRCLGEHALPEVARAAEAALRSSAEATVRLQAAIALGRVGDAACIPDLILALDTPDLFLRHAAFTALHRIGARNAEAWAPMVAAMAHSVPRIRENVVYAFRNAYSAPLVRALAAVVFDETLAERQRVAALQALAPLHRKAPDWNGEWWAYHPFRLQPPARTVAWVATPDVLHALRLAATDPSPALRVAAAEALGNLVEADGADLLLSRLQAESHPQARAALLRSLAQMRPAQGDEAIARLLLATPAGSPVAPETFALALAVPGPRVLEAATGLAVAPAGDPRAPQAVQILAESRATNVVPTLVAALESPDPAVRNAALAAAREGRWKAAVPALLRLARQPATRERARDALLALPTPEAADLYLEALASRDARVRSVARGALAATRDAAWPVLASRIDGLPPEVIGDLQRIFRGHAPAAASGLMQRAAPNTGPPELKDAALQASGDRARGRALFRDPTGLACLACHRVQGEGGGIGPDLSGIGAQLDAPGIAEAILWPSKSVREGYDVVLLDLDDDESISGMIRSETASEVVVQPAAGDPIRLLKSRIRRRTSTGRSLMPDGLGDGLTPEAFADLLAYLASLRSGS